MRSAIPVGSAVLMLAIFAVAQQQPTSTGPAVASPSAPLTQAVAKTEDPEQGLLQVRRICVDTFGDDVMAKQIRDAVIANLAETKRFIVTENKDRADAVLRGTGVEQSSQEYHEHAESTAAAAAGGSHVGFGGAGMAIADRNASTETLRQARVSVRLVNKDGDVIWATTQESANAKYKTATADVADKVVKQLLRSVSRLEKATQTSPAQ